MVYGWMNAGMAQGKDFREQFSTQLQEGTVHPHRTSQSSRVYSRVQGNGRPRAGDVAGPGGRNSDGELTGDRVF